MNEPLPADLLALEAELAALRPSGAPLDRDRLLFEAGRASAAPARRRFVWPAATAAMTAAAACLAVMLFYQPPPQVVERVRIVEVERLVPAEPVDEEVAANAAAGGDMRSMAQRPQPEAARSRPHSAAVIPRAGADFRLFEHLIGQPTVPVGTGATSQAEDDEPEVLSPRSLPRLLMSADGERDRNV